MAAPSKPESSPPAKGPDAAADAGAGAPSKSGAAGWLPVIVAVVLAPAATWGTVEFVLLPRLQKKLAAGAGEHGTAAEHAAPAESGGHGGEKHGGKPEGGGKGEKGKGGGEAGTYEFQNVVVNLAGTMGTRYLKTSFLVTGADPGIRGIFDGSKPKLMDVTLNVLSSLTLADLEEPGAKNVIREKLVSAYNQALGRKVADQVYFSDFVIQ